MKKWTQARNWMAMALCASAWGCGANGPGAEVDDEAEHLGSSSEALAANGSGTTYAEQCLANGVPLPPKFGTSTVLSPGVYEYGKWTKQSDSHIQFTDFAQARVYTTASVAPGQEGLCVIAAHYDEGPSSFDVICQGKNGKACFWESFSAPYDPPATPIYITSMDSGTALASNGHDMCTKCHAGRNAFITHFGTTDGLNGQNDPWGMHDQWMPTSSSWYTPIVPTGWLENPGPSNAGYPSTCTGCHSAGGAAGPFPTLRTPEFAGEKYCKILDRVVHSPGTEGGMPPTTPCSSRDAANCPANTDPQVQEMLAACGKALPSQAVSYKSSPVAVTGYSTGTPYTGSWDHVLAGTDVYGTTRCTCSTTCLPTRPRVGT